MRITVFCPNWVGDAVMATPTLHALRQRYPGAQIVGVMKQVIADTLAGNPWIDEYLVLERLGETARQRWWQAIRLIRREPCDIAVLLTNTFFSAAVSWMGGASRRVGYARECRSILLTDALAPKWTWRGYTPTPIIDYYLALAGRVGADISSKQMRLFVDPKDSARASQLLSKLHIRPQEPLILLNPGSAFGPAKRWPTASFAELARTLVDEKQGKVLLLCGPGERELAREIASLAERQSCVVSLADEKVSIGLTKALVARARLLVTTDSGPRHFAAALGVPVVSLFGPTHIQWTETYYAGETTIQKQVPCGPCQQRTCPQGHHRCMNELGVGEVLAIVRRQLQQPIPLVLPRVA